MKLFYDTLTKAIPSATSLSYLANFCHHTYVNRTDCLKFIFKTAGKIETLKRF